MALEKRTSRLFGSRLSAIFSSNDHPHLENRDSANRSVSHTQNASRATAQPLSRAPLVNSGRSVSNHKGDQSPTSFLPEPVQNAPQTASKGARFQVQDSNVILPPEGSHRAQTPVNTGRRHRKPPPPLELPTETAASPFRQLLQMPATKTELNAESRGNGHEGLTDIIDSLEEEIGQMMVTSQPTDSLNLSEWLRLASAEPTDPLNFRTMVDSDATGVHKTKETYDFQQNTTSSRVPSQEPQGENALFQAKGPPNQRLYRESAAPYPLSDDLSSLLFTPKDDIQGPPLPAYGCGRRSMNTDEDLANHGSPIGVPRHVNPEESSPLKSTMVRDALPIPENIEFAAEESEYNLSGDSESMHTLEQQLSGLADEKSFSTQDNSIASSRNSFIVQSPEGLRQLHSIRSQESGGGSNSLSDLPFFVAERFASSRNESKSNLGLILEDTRNAERANHDYFLNTNATPLIGPSVTQGSQGSPGYPLSEIADAFLSYTFGQTSLPNPRSPLKPTQTFMSTDSGVSRTWSNSALLKNFHARMLLTSSITSNSSNRHVNLATLKRSFSLRPGEGERSMYVQTIRRNAGTSYNDTGPGNWKLPAGIMPVDKKSLYLQVSNNFNRGGSGARGTRSKKTSGVELKHGHLQPRMLAAEVDDNDDSNRFGSLGRSTTANTLTNTRTNTTISTSTQKAITPMTSKSSNVSILGGISRDNSLNRSKSLASDSTNNDIQSVQTGDSKLSSKDSDVSSLNSNGSISEYKFGEGYFQHPGYKYDDEPGTGSFTPSTENGTVNPSYDDIDYIDEDSEEEEKPRLFLANPDLSSGEE